MTDTEYSSTPEAAVDSPRWGKHMFTAGIVVVAAVEIYFGVNSQARTQIHLLLGLAIIFLGFLPMLIWAKKGQASLPVFETLMLTGVNTYALPLLNGHKELINYSDESITTSATGILLFQAVAIATYQLTSGQPRLGRFWREEVISRDIGRWLMYGMALNTLYIFLSTFTTLIPDSIGSVLRAVFFGVGIICTFITSRRLGQGELTQSERMFFFVNIGIQCIGMLSTLFLVTVISLLLLTLVGYVSSSGRVPLVLTAGTVFLLAILHSGKSAMRDKYWEGDDHRMPTISELPAFFSNWFQHGLDRTEGKEKDRLTSKLIDRTSLFHIMCLVVDATPAKQPYLNGETYRDIPAQFVPRFFWPDKPLGHASTSRLSVYYGLQTEEETYKTTIGFGMLTEAYSNFGFFGLGGIAVLLAFWFKKIQCWAAGGPLLSYGGILLIILLAWSFQVEFTLSIWLASLYQACVAVLGVPMLVRKFFGA